MRSGYQARRSLLQIWLVLLCAVASAAPVEGETEQRNSPADPSVAAESETVQTSYVEVAPSQTTPLLTTERVEQLLHDTEQDAKLSPEARAPIIEIYRAALTDLRSSQELEARREALTTEAETTPTRAEKIREKLEELKTKQPVVDDPLSLAELEQQLNQLELQLAPQKQARTAAESESQIRSQRRKEIRARLVTIQQRMEETKGQLTSLAAKEATQLTFARNIQFAAQRAMLDNELPALEAELTKYDAEEALGLIRLRTDLATRRVASTEKSIEQIGIRIKAAREQAAAESVRKARLEAIATDSSLKAYADQNQQLAEKAKLVAGSLAKAEQDLKAATEVHEQLIRQFQQTRKKVESVGLTSSVGALLRKQRSTLPDVRERKSAVASRQTLINDTQYELFEYEDERQAITDAEDSIARMLKDAGSRETVNEEVLKSAAQDLVSREQEYLDALIRNSGQYFDTLIELDTTDQQVITLVAEYENYIDQRVLWIRSARTLTSDFTVEPADTWLLQPAKWSEAGRAISDDARRRVALYLLASLIVAGFLVCRHRLRTRLIEAGEVAGKANCRTIGPTTETALATLLLSAGWPVLCIFFAWRLNKSSMDSEFTKAIGQGLLCVGVVWLAIDFLRQVCRPAGLAEAHFRWPAAATETIRRELRTLLVLALPLTFVTATLSAINANHGRNVIERTAYVIGMCVLTLVIYRLLRPSGVPRDYLSAHKEGWVDRLKYAWPIAAACIPIALAALAASGFYYTAKTLFWHVFATGMFVMGLLMVRSLLLRMLMLRRRSLSIEQSRQRAAAAVAGEGDGSHLVGGIVTETPESDITTHSLQSRRLVNTALVVTSMVGLWGIWVQVLPALGMLDKYPLWGGTTPIAAVVTDATSTSEITPAPVPPTSPSATSVRSADNGVVTASDLALAILIACVTFVLARNGPGLLEISVLQQLPVDTSVRYAITTLVSYAIVLAGTIATCSTIGLQWSQIQWLATALTFGLAFGLQEMFANFVAGLIILLERPIRVGDVVTVDDVTGVVSKIRIRATSITNWDRKEYVVPNKEFITGRLLNWTLSDKVNRIVINVGLAYGSDTERARALLLQAANDHPLILQDPPSLATFEGFGDNALNLVLRTYLPTLDNRLEVIHQLHTAIDQAFRKEGIEVAFPQRDLHIRTVPSALRTALDGDPQHDAAPRDGMNLQDRNGQRDAA